MARGINKVILVGNLGADPETRTSAGGTTVTNIRLATTEAWRDKQTGENQERTEWHRVVLFGRLGEIADQYLRKGRQVYIEGSLRTSKYTDREGIERYTTDIVASEMQMLGGGGEGGGGARRGGGATGGDDFGRQGDGGYARHGRDRDREPEPRPAGDDPLPSGSGGGSEDLGDDDIPF